MVDEYLNYENIKNALKNNVGKFTIDDYKFVFEKIQDEKSKRLFYYRIMYDNTKDIYYCLKMLQTMYFEQIVNNKKDFNTKNLIDFLLKNKNYQKKIYIIGYNKNLIKQILLNIYIDSNNIKNIKNIKILKYINMKKNIFTNDSIFIIGNNFNYKVKEKLIKKGIEEKNIFVTYNDTIFSNLCIISSYAYKKGIQYFGEPFLEKNKNEIFIDCGAYLLETTCDFISWCDGDYKKIYALEPNTKLYNKCKKIIRRFKFKNIELFNKGAWNKEENLGFKNRRNGDSTFKFFENDWDLSVSVINIDKLLNNTKVTLIKMDVEGSEYEAIVGAKKTIIKYKPRLLISGYHIPNDCIKLAKKILEYNPNYKIYIRHYNFNMYETVLYFI